MISLKHSEACRRNGKLYGGLDPQPLDVRIKKFWSNVQKTGDCWWWKAARTRSGYGHFCYLGKAIRAHRFAWMITHGDIPSGMIVCHKCDHPGCVRPEHLFVGTYKDNSKDCFAKGRGKPPQSPFKRGLTDEQIIWARSAHVPYKRSAPKLAKELGVTLHCVKSALWPSARMRPVVASKGDEGATVRLETI